MFKLVKRTYETAVIIKHAIFFSTSTLSNLILGGYFTTGDVMLNEEYLEMVESGKYKFLC